jgi:hypothetical protein
VPFAPGHEPPQFLDDHGCSVAAAADARSHRPNLRSSEFEGRPGTKPRKLSVSAA